MYSISNVGCKGFNDPRCMSAELNISETCHLDMNKLAHVGENSEIIRRMICKGVLRMYGRFFYVCSDVYFTYVGTVIFQNVF